MANFMESMERFAQSAVSKSKEVAETTSINLEISSLEQQLQGLYAQAGRYAIDRRLLPTEEAEIQAILTPMEQLQERLAQCRQALLELRNACICPSCGAEISRLSNFCDRCGAPVERPQPQPQQTAEEMVCPGCGAAVGQGDLFCGSCGKKLKE